ncbi:AraC family transcriptional regulator [Planctomycetota bacterium]
MEDHQDPGGTGGLQRSTPLSSGFPDANYFSRLFKKHTGASPAAYRINHR